jgi:osmotically-inducible protein OsmY
MTPTTKYFKRLCLASAIGLALGAGAASADKPLATELDEAQKEGRIYASYALNRHLNPFEFEVTVDGSQVILQGTVEESIDKDLAEQIALSVNGIAKVDNQIKVDSSVGEPARKAGQRSFGEAVEDATITAGVKSKLLWNDNTDGLDIKVETKQGVVTLTGVADSAASKELAGYLAANTGGARDVDNRLTVSGKSDTDRSADRAGEAVSDAWISAKVKSSFLYSKHVAGSDIGVATANGVVKLTGAVESDREKALAVELAKNVRGVREVDASGLNAGS